MRGQSMLDTWEHNKLYEVVHVSIKTHMGSRTVYSDSRGTWDTKIRVLFLILDFLMQQHSMCKSLHVHWSLKVLICYDVRIVEVHYNVTLKVQK